MGSNLVATSLPSSMPSIGVDAEIDVACEDVHKCA